MRHLLLLLTLAPLSSSAAPKVVLFGGVQSTRAKMAACFPDITVYDLAEGPGEVEALAKKIDADPDGGWVIAGHSSGAAVAENVARKVKNHSRMHLVLLDGYGHEGIQAKVRTTCWYASNGRLESLNAGAMKNTCLARSAKKRHLAVNSVSAMSLHYSLVNLNVPSTIPGPHGGYWNNCRPNTSWIEP